MKKYIHYGSEPFDRNLIQPIQNRQYFTKPWGGFWASPVDATFGWKQWCEREGFALHRFGHSFTFTLSPEAKVLTISSTLDLHGLPHGGNFGLDLGMVCLDFEELLRQGYDAVELELSRDWELYWSLYGWDCDSIVILNPDIIVEVKERQEKLELRRFPAWELAPRAASTMLPCSICWAYSKLWCRGSV